MPVGCGGQSRCALAFAARLDQFARHVTRDVEGLGYSSPLRHEPG
jgi:hypothetical protein